MADSISIATARYGKWLAGDDADGPVNVAADHSFTALSKDFPPELRRWASPSQLGAPHWGGEMLNEDARDHGGFVIRPVKDWVLVARLRQRPEAGEGKIGRTYIQVEAAAMDRATWRRHGDSALLGLARMRPVPDRRPRDGGRIVAKPLNLAIRGDEFWRGLAHIAAGQRWDVAANRGFAAALERLRDALRSRDDAPAGGWAFDYAAFQPFRTDGPFDLRFLAALALALRAERGPSGLPDVAATTGYRAPVDFATIAYVSDAARATAARRVAMSPPATQTDAFAALNWDRAQGKEKRDETAAAAAAAEIARQIAPVLRYWRETLTMPAQLPAPPTPKQSLGQRHAVVAWLLGQDSGQRSLDGLQMSQRLLRAIDAPNADEDLETQIARILLSLPTVVDDTKG